MRNDVDVDEDAQGELALDGALLDVGARPRQLGLPLPHGGRWA